MTPTALHPLQVQRLRIELDSATASKELGEAQIGELARWAYHARLLGLMLPQ